VGVHPWLTQIPLPFFLLFPVHEPQHSNYHKHCNNDQSYNRHSDSSCNSWHSWHSWGISQHTNLVGEVLTKLNLCKLNVTMYHKTLYYMSGCVYIISVYTYILCMSMYKIAKFVIYKFTVYSIVYILVVSSSFPYFKMKKRGEETTRKLVVLYN